MSNRTFLALVSRGIDNKTADSIAKTTTLEQLKIMSVKALQHIGLTEEQANNILNEQRPPIPKDTLSNVLYKSRMTCCVCRDQTQPIIVHHIVEWSKSKSHDESNLVVLCLMHHDCAHTTKNLSQNLNQASIKSFKAQWENDVAKMDARSILSLKKDDGARWDWIK